jgi:hypothetical protein
VVKQLIEDLCEPVTWPWPTAFAAVFLFCQALFIDIDYDYPWVDSAGHSEDKTRVIDNRLKASQKRYLDPFCSVQNENGNQGDAYARSDELLFQLESRLALQYPPVLRKVVKIDTIKPVM